MADHSLRGYLERRTIEELDALLAYCLQEANYQHVILEIVSVLKDRSAPEDAAPRIKEHPVQNQTEC